MAHALALDHINSIDVHFACSVCGQIIGFNKPGIGVPAAVQLEDGTWTTPENPDQWMAPCIE